MKLESLFDCEHAPLFSVSQCICMTIGPGVCGLVVGMLCVGGGVVCLLFCAVYATDD